MNKILRGSFFARLFVLYHWVTFNVREFYLARATSNNFKWQMNQRFETNVEVIVNYF